MKGTDLLLMDLGLTIWTTIDYELIIIVYVIDPLFIKWYFRGVKYSESFGSSIININV